MNQPSTIFCVIACLLPVTHVAGQEWDLGGYQELAEGAEVDVEPSEVALQRQSDQPEVSAEVAPSNTPTLFDIAKVPDSLPAASVEKEKVVLEAPVATEYPEHVIRFGAGASWVRPLRLADMRSDDQLLSDFSVSWTPFGLPTDIGVDLLIAREQKFFVRPNLKLFLYRHYWFSLFVEGTCELMFLTDSTEVGGGGGLGMVIGLTDTLAIEIKASATVTDLSPGGNAELFGPSDALSADLLETTNGDKRLAVLPSATVHLMARF